MVSEIKVDKVLNQSSDQDSGLDLSTNDVVKVNIAGSEKVRVDANGSVGVSVTPSAWDTSASGRTPVQVNFGSISGRSSDLQSEISNNCYSSGTGNSPQWSGITRYAKTQMEMYGDGSIRFKNAATVDQSTFDSSPNFSFTERMRIDSSGAVLINTTSATGTSKLVVESDTTTINPLTLSNTRTSSNTDYAILFYRAGSLVGSVQTSLSATSYVTSSDYRLKENVTTSWDATSRLKQLKPSRFNFKADKDTTLDGFLAHEVSSVVPEAITGTKDAVEVWKKEDELPEGVSVGDNKLDDDGNTIPIMQGIDQSKLVPLLVKTIQELEARIAVLEAK